MAKEKQPAPADLGIPEHPGTSLAEVSDEVMAGAFPGGEPEPAPKAEPKPGAKAEPEVETPLEPEPEVKPGAETVAEPKGGEAAAPVEEEFDPVAWAEAQNIPVDLVKACKSPLEAANAVARRLRHREALGGRKDIELADLRKKHEEAEALRRPPEREGAPETAAPAAAGPVKTEAEVKAEWTEEQREQFRTWQEAKPEEAAAYMFEQQFGPREAAIREENRREIAAVRSEMKAAQEAPHEAELEEEYVAFVAAHPEDHDVFRQEEMPILAKAFGLPTHARDGLPTDVGLVMGAKLEDLYALTKLRDTAPKMYGQIVRDMRSGMDYERARRVAELELGVKPAGAGQRAAEQVRTAKGAAAATAGAGVGAPQPLERDIRELPDEHFKTGTE